MKYIIKGKVIHGEGYGKKIGYPTINLDRRNFLSLELRPKFGVYAGHVDLSNKIYRAGIIIGPLDAKKLPKIEAHLLSYKGNAYGKKVIIHIDKFIREYKHFKKEEELIAQIGKDLKKC